MQIENNLKAEREFIMNQNQSNLFLEDIILNYGRVNAYLENEYLVEVEGFEIILKSDKQGYKAVVYYQYQEDGETQTDLDNDLTEVFQTAEESVAYAQALTSYLSHVIPVTTAIDSPKVEKSQSLGKK